MHRVIKLLIFIIFLSYLIGCSDEGENIRITADIIRSEDFKEQQPINAYCYGSPHLFNLITPKLYSKLDLNGSTIYQNKVVRAFKDKRLALLYTANDVDGLSFGVNLLACKSPKEPI